jgi:hypothetical protein
MPRAKAKAKAVEETAEDEAPTEREPEKPTKEVSIRTAKKTMLNILHELEARREIPKDVKFEEEIAKLKRVTRQAEEIFEEYRYKMDELWAETFI